MRRPTQRLREDFVDPAEVWAPQLSSPIPKLLGGLLSIALTLAATAWGIGQFHTLIFFPILSIGYALREIVPACERLRAFRHYEAWLAEPEAAPRHLGALTAGIVLVVIIALELFVCWYSW